MHIEERARGPEHCSPRDARLGAEHLWCPARAPSKFPPDQLRARLFEWCFPHCLLWIVGTIPSDVLASIHLCLPCIDLTDPHAFLWLMLLQCKKGSIPRQASLDSCCTFGPNYFLRISFTTQLPPRYAADAGMPLRAVLTDDQCTRGHHMASYPARYLAEYGTTWLFSPVSILRRGHTSLENSSSAPGC